jgi:hypothetical protein
LNPTQLRRTQGWDQLSREDIGLESNSVLLKSAMKTTEHKGNKPWAQLSTLDSSLLTSRAWTPAMIIIEQVSYRSYDLNTMGNSLGT